MKYDNIKINYLMFEFGAMYFWRKARMLMPVLTNNLVYSRRTEYQPLFHCNYGWAGTCNGYYDPNLFFDASAGPEYTEIVNGDQWQKNDKVTSYYSHCMKLITYTSWR